MNKLPDRGHDAVAVILALGVTIVVTLFMIAAVIDAFNKETEISENATQVLTAAIGGMIGVLGGYIGGRAVQRRDQDQAVREDYHHGDEQ